MLNAVKNMPRSYVLMKKMKSQGEQTVMAITLRNTEGASSILKTLLLKRLGETDNKENTRDLFCRTRDELLSQNLELG
jgi:hypothetical protein